MRAFIFDLDGTLVDTVYAHVLALQQALEEAGIVIDGWRIHRRIGMSGGLFTRRLRACPVDEPRGGLVPRTPAVSAAYGVWPAIRRRCGSGRATGAR